MTKTQGTALVTGGAAGIGLACAKILLREGWRVVGLDRDETALAAARADCAEFGDAIRFEALDVTDEAACKALVARVSAEFGPIRGVVTSAGVGANISFFDTTPDQFRRINEVNVIGTFNVARAAVDAMTQGGAIVTISSVSGIVGNVGRSAYGASKGAVINLTRIMAAELARRGIRVNSVAPGPIETAMAVAFHSAEVRQQWCDDVMLKRYGTVEEVGEAVAFLLSDKASYVTGQVLAVDGGFVAGGLVERSWD